VNIYLFRKKKPASIYKFVTYHLKIFRDEEYDTGKRKKLRGLKQSFVGPNIFQQIATEKSTQLKRAKLDHSNSGNPPFRI
jgi:hypothetical protein